MLLVCLVALLHEPVEFKLFEIVALRSLLWMHRWVLNGREHYIVFLLTVRELYLGRLWHLFSTLGNLLFAERHSTFFADLLVKFNHVCLSLFTITV